VGADALQTAGVVPDALEAAGVAVVCDALDRLGHRTQAMDPGIRPLWPRARVVGWAFPVEVVVDERDPASPYDLEMSALDAMGPGDVGVYSVQPGSRAATWGELFTCAAMGRGVRGVVVDGCIRDGAQVEALGFPTFLRGYSPYDTLRRAVVARYGEPVRCGGVTAARGDLVVADVDGIVVVPAAAVPTVAEAVGAKRILERGARQDLLAGMSVRAVWDKYRVF
jgi:regulator of RNase E activity RraA